MMALILNETSLTKKPLELHPSCNISPASKSPLSDVNNFMWNRKRGPRGLNRASCIILYEQCGSFIIIMATSHAYLLCSSRWLLSDEFATQKKRSPRQLCHFKSYKNSEYKFFKSPSLRSLNPANRKNPVDPLISYSSSHLPLFLDSESDYENVCMNFTHAPSKLISYANWKEIGTYSHSKTLIFLRSLPIMATLDNENGTAR